MSGSDVVAGLTAAEAARRLSTFGPNEIAAEKPPSAWTIAVLQFRDPMNLMLAAVVVVSLVIGELSTGVIVALLIALNLGLGTRQELTARASVDALAKMQVPQARVIRDGQLSLVPATQLVPGDLVQVEAGDMMGQIATMLSSVTRTKSPLQKELDALTKVLGIIAWGAVAVIVVAGLIRGTTAKELLLLGTAMAISAIPTGMPAFVSGLLSLAPSSWPTPRQS